MLQYRGFTCEDMVVSRQPVRRQSAPGPYVASPPRPGTKDMQSRNLFLHSADYFDKKCLVPIIFGTPQPNSIPDKYQGLAKMLSHGQQGTKDFKDLFSLARNPENVWYL